MARSGAEVGFQASLRQAAECGGLQGHYTSPSSVWSMHTPSTCPSCRKGLLRWETRRTADRSVDTFTCEACDYVLAEEDWHIPVQPLSEGRCRNCCGRRVEGTCLDCELSSAEDLEVHEELRRLIHPTADLLASTRLAVAMGRRLIALKLATAAALDGPQPEVARCLRIQLLRGVGEELAALSDAREWVHEAGRNSAMAWAAYADELAATKKHGEAIEAFRKALELAPNAHGARARFARLLMDLQRFGQAHEEALAVLDHPGNREATLAALEVMAGYVELLMLRGETMAVREVLEELGPRARRHPVFLCASAALAVQDERLPEAKADLKAARKLQSDHPLIRQIEKTVQSARKGWFPW